MRDWILTGVGPAAIAVLLGLAFLHMFFRTIESRWPTSYFALVSGPDYAISRNLLRYLTFRLAPVFVVGVFVAVTLERAAIPAYGPVVIIGVAHAVVTSGRAFAADVKSSRRRQRVLRLLVHLVVMGMLAATAVVSVWWSPMFEGLVPGLERITSDLLVGLVAGVIAAYAIRVSAGSHVDMDEILKTSRRAIPAEIWGAVPELSAVADADPTLIRAVMLVENIQRPGWVRRIERWGARVIGKPATLGVLQTPGQAGETDLELLERAIASTFSGQHLPRTWEDQAGWKATERFLIRYNPDRHFVDAVHEAVAFLQQ